MEDRYVFREIQKEEIPQMFALILNRMKWMDEKGIKQWNVTNYDTIYPLQYYEDSREKGEIFVLADQIDEEIVCAGALKEEDERWPTDHIPAFYLHHFVASAERNGVGKIFLQFAQEYAMKKGKAYFRLDSAVKNQTLTAYYERNGFLPAGRCVDGVYEGILRQRKVYAGSSIFWPVSHTGIVWLAGDKRIGIDGLSRDRSAIYPDTPPQVRENFILDILIFTHEHEDHFCAEYVKEAWGKNPNLQIYSTAKTIEILQREDLPSCNLHRVEDGQVLLLDNLSITFLQTLHEGEHYADIQNLTLLMKKDDETYVITGDAMPRKELFERISRYSRNITWFFAPFPYVGLHSTRKLMKEYLDIQNIFVLHQPRQKADQQGWVARAKHVCERATDGLPYPIFPIIDGM